MNTDMAQGNWTEIKGKIKTKWARFTDNDVEAFKGNLDQIVGKVQQTYGYAKEKAEQEFEDFKKSLSAAGNSVIDAAKKTVNDTPFKDSSAKH